MSVSPAELQRYLKAHGWRLRPEALKERELYWFENPALQPHQIVFLSDENAPDYQESLQLAVSKIAEAQNLTQPALLAAIAEAGEDTLRFRLFGPYLQEHRVPLSFMADALLGAKQLLLAAAHSILNPRHYHPRMGRREALDFFNTANFGQTEPGSFVFKVTCPVAENFSLFPNDAEPPLSRQATLALNSAMHSLSEALRFDTLGQLIEQEKANNQTVISANLCEALTRLQDEKIQNDLDISFAWAVTVVAPEFARKENWVRFAKDDFKRIAEVGDALRAIEGTKESLFLATVEELNGVMGNDGRRFGEVVFRVLQPEEENPIRARANLSAEDYIEADKAHMNDGSYALFHAKLHPGRQPRLLTEIDSFEWYFENQDPNAEKVVRKIRKP